MSHNTAGCKFSRSLLRIAVAAALIGMIHIPSMALATEWPKRSNLFINLHGHWLLFMPADRGTVELTLHRLGYLPETLAAAGVGGSVTTSVLTTASEWIVLNGLSLNAADEALAAAHFDAVVIERSLRRGSDTYVPSDLVRAKRAVGDAQANVNALLANLNASLAALMSGNQNVVLTRMHSQCKWRCSTELSAVSLTEEEWLAVKNCLGSEHRDPDPADQIVFDHATTSSEYLAAQANRASLAVAVNYAWESFWE